MCFTDRLQCFEHRGLRCISLHCVGNDGFRQRLGTAWFADQEEWNAQLNADHHHEHVLFESLVACDVRTKINSVQKHVLTPTETSPSFASKIPFASMSGGASNSTHPLITHSRTTQASRNVYTDRMSPLPLQISLNFMQYILHITKKLYNFLSGWRRGSMVRTSVFCWRTFPDLRLIYG